MPVRYAFCALRYATWVPCAYCLVKLLLAASCLLPAVFLHAPCPMPYVTNNLQLTVLAFAK